MSERSADPSRLASLDGWRAIAILLVLVSHIPYAAGCPQALSSLITALVNGNLGVRIFFTISGFIITWLLLGELERNDRINLPDFYLRRSLRILPVYLGYLGLILLLQVLGRLSEDPTSWFGSLSFARNMFGRGDSPTVHFWSLAIEEQFYLFWPPVLALLHRRRRTLFILIALVLLSAPLMRLLPPPLGGNLIDRLQGPRSFFRYSDALMMGCLAALLFKTAYCPPSPRRAWLALACILLPELLPNRFVAPIAFLVPLLEAWATAELMLWTIVSRGLPHRILNSRPLVFIGLLSYSLYVWHMVFLDAFAPQAFAWLHLDLWYLWWIPSLACALASYALLEWPARRLRAKRLHFPSKPTLV